MGISQLQVPPDIGLLVEGGVCKVWRGSRCHWLVCLQESSDALAQLQLAVGGRSLVSELASLAPAITGPADSAVDLGADTLVGREPRPAGGAGFGGKGAAREVQGVRPGEHWSLGAQRGQGSFGEVWQAVRRTKQENGDALPFV